MLSSTSQEENRQVQCSPIQDLCAQEYFEKDEKLKQLYYKLERFKETSNYLKVENEGLKRKQVDIRQKVVVCNEKANSLRDELKSAKLKIQDLEKESEDQFNLSLDIETLKRRSEKAENKVIRELQEKCERLKEQLKYRNVSYKILQDQMNKMEVRSRETSKTDEEKILNIVPILFEDFYFTMIRNFADIVKQNESNNQADKENALPMVGAKGEEEQLTVSSLEPISMSSEESYVIDISNEQKLESVRAEVFCVQKLRDQIKELTAKEKKITKMFVEYKDKSNALKYQLKISEQGKKELEEYVVNFNNYLDDVYKKLADWEQKLEKAEKQREYSWVAYRVLQGQMDYEENVSKKQKEYIKQLEILVKVKLEEWKDVVDEGEQQDSGMEEDDEKNSPIKMELNDNIFNYAKQNFEDFDNFKSTANLELEKKNFELEAARKRIKELESQRIIPAHYYFILFLIGLYVLSTLF
ncbi:hypothetical protein GCK72_019562 [Caenorhabditis remanei]|uniref:Uncharacterized protein n=1 Tax=Caenorhabditis remanei TaxID=31234 RepID=A0A6A5GCM5_CAERE|nr:hypothetical protein GCK72_019562 [Caenorhabditis remanei]KAF1753007.1 hypothetical protein GCK72_019562 [Caenorhabditis remanei]